jgi:hypothetical protein
VIHDRDPYASWATNDTGHGRPWCTDK